MYRRASPTERLRAQIDALFDEERARLIYGYAAAAGGAAVAIAQCHGL